MDLKAWRVDKGWTQERLGQELGFPASSRASQAERIENGKIPADADVVAAIEAITQGAVRSDDMHHTRLTWLREKGKARDFVGRATA